MKEHPSYYAIIPAEVRYDATLRPNEKLMYGEISALASATGECWASNRYFAELYGVSTQAASKWIKNLETRGYITTSYDESGQHRRIHLTAATLNDRLRGINERLRDPQPQVEHNNINIILKNNNRRKTKFHNFDERQYTDANYEALERMMK